MSIEPSHVAPTGDSTPTERFASFRQPHPQQPVRQQTTVNSSPISPALNHSPRAQRTRRTVDLPVPTHRALDRWQRDAADHLGVARVTGQEVITALIEQLLVDPRLGAQITRAIQARRSAS